MLQGHLKKMKTHWVDSKTPVSYSLRLNNDCVPLNHFIGKNIKLEFTGKIACVHCGRSIKKTFNQGYCFPCFQTLAECDSCLIKPETCHHHLGTCRDNDFAETHCFIPHVVYLAVSSDLKVGITREFQKLTRWADQGAKSALVIAQVSNRKLAGELEVKISRHMSDKTNWRKMLSLDIPQIDLIAKRDEIKNTLPTETNEHFVEESPIELVYPVERFPQKISSYNLDKIPHIEDVLWGIKGQYLIFSKKVINLRKYQGYEIKWSES